MSTTETKWPTRIELTDLLYRNFTVSTGHGERHDFINFAYDVLAQWGNALPQISVDGLQPSMDEVMGLAKAFGLEVNSPEALMWLVVTALAAWGDIRPESSDIEHLGRACNVDASTGAASLPQVCR
jgi:hypothetical protein